MPKYTVWHREMQPSEGWVFTSIEAPTHAEAVAKARYEICPFAEVEAASIGHVFGRLLVALKRFVNDYDPECPPDDMPDAGCIECTAGTVPNDRNTGLCKYHQAREAIARAEGGQ